MAFPNFLGIGAMRSGTSWLDVQLRTHPDIYMPNRRKEVHFFDDYYSRGGDWYRKFFPSDSDAGNWSAIGEITPRYLYDLNVADRIHRMLPDTKLIAILRNPVDRAYSQYGLSVKKAGETGTFTDFIERSPDAFAKGLYHHQLQRYYDLFPPENILVLIFERVHGGDRDLALKRIAEFLDVDPNGFPEHDVKTQVAKSHFARFPRASALATRGAKLVRDFDQDWIVNLAKSLGVPRLFGNRGPIPPLEWDARLELFERYANDISALEQLIGEDLSHWRPTITQTDQPEAVPKAAKAA